MKNKIFTLFGITIIGLSLIVPTASARVKDCDVVSYEPCYFFEPMMNCTTEASGGCGCIIMECGWEEE